MKVSNKLILIICALITILCFTLNADKKEVLPKNERKISTKKDVWTADWYKDEECRMVFYTVLQGLYEDGISDEVVNLVIGRVETNSVEKRFVFKCKLCHACYEAFAAYQRRPAFHGAKGVKTIGSKTIPPEVMKNLQDNVHDGAFGRAFATIIQPWIKKRLLSMDLSEKDKVKKMQKFADLASEGNALLGGQYKQCQACDAIDTVSKIMKVEK
jgi:hypothetical protein